jgi:hypothetical protein
VRGLVQPKKMTNPSHDPRFASHAAIFLEMFQLFLCVLIGYGSGELAFGLFSHKSFFTQDGQSA